MNKLIFTDSSSSGLATDTDINRRGGFTLEGCSPKERYEKLVQRFADPQNPNNRIDPPSLYEGDQRAEAQCSQAVEGDIVEQISGEAETSREFSVLNEICQGSLTHSLVPLPEESRSRRIVEGATIRPIHSQPLISGSSSVEGFVISTIIAVASTYFNRIKYNEFAEKINKKIAELTLALRNDEITCSVLIRQFLMLHLEKEASEFSGVFDQYNPCTIASFFLTWGLAYDSNGEYEIACIEYKKALKFPIDQLLKDRIHYALARSMRLLGCYCDAKVELSQIDLRSPLQPLVQVERAAIAHRAEAVFDDNGIPFDFRCPLTGEVIKICAEYVLEGQTFRCEDNSIRAWISFKSTCPFTGARLMYADLKNDLHWSLMIDEWNQTKLKKK